MYEVIAVNSYNVSTHAPLARRDTAQILTKVGGGRFQLTRLLRGATVVLFVSLFIVLSRSYSANKHLLKSFFSFSLSSSLLAAVIP